MATSASLREERLTISIGKKAIPAVLFLPPGSARSDTAVLLTHGAGGDMDEEQISLMASEIALQGIVCLRFTYKNLRLPKRVEIYKNVVHWLIHSKDYGIKKCIVGGRSMGSRAAAELLIDSELEDVVIGGLFLSFPLHKPGETVLREEALLKLEKPTLFASGTKDPMCHRSLLSQVQDKMLTKPEVVWVEAADHSGMPPRKKRDAFEVPDYFHTVVTWICELAKETYNPEKATNNSPGKKPVAAIMAKKRRALGDDDSAKRKHDVVASCLTR